MNPTVSIVLPVCNGGRYLRQSIESCLRQSYIELELILVDDGSTDSTPTIMQEYAKLDPRVRVLTHGQNRGLPQALNTGFAFAAGQYLTWTSADNYYRPHALATMVQGLESDATIAVVYSDYSLFDEEGRLLEYRTAGDTRDLLFANRVGACFLYRRKVQEELRGYDEDLILAEDYDFWLRASACFRMAPLHEDLYCCRDHRDSLSVRYVQRTEVNAARCLERNLPRLHWATRSEKAEAYVQLARRAQLRGAWTDARRNLLSAMREAPLRSLLFIVRRTLRVPQSGSTVPNVAGPNHT